MAQFTRTVFCIDAITGKKFPGYTSGDTWNGWACPYFEQKVATEVLEASRANGYKWEYEPNNDLFRVRSIDDPEDYGPEEFGAQTIHFQGREVKVYGIGAYSWIWEECQNAE